MWGRKNYSKGKKSKFRKHASLRDTDSMFKLILHAKSKAWIFADGFCGRFIGRGFTRDWNIWIKLQSNTVHYIITFFVL